MTVEISAAKVEKLFSDVADAQRFIEGTIANIAAHGSDAQWAILQDVLCSTRKD